MEPTWFPLPHGSIVDGELSNFRYSLERLTCTWRRSAAGSVDPASKNKGLYHDVVLLEQQRCQASELRDGAARGKYDTVAMNVSLDLCGGRGAR